MSDEIEILDTIERTGYKMTTVGELLRELAILPPMMPIQSILSIDDYHTAYYFNGISIQDNTLILHLGAPEAKKRTFEPTHEEQETEKRHKALDMGREKKEAQEPYG